LNPNGLSIFQSRRELYFSMGVTRVCGFCPS